MNTPPDSRLPGGTSDITAPARTITAGVGKSHLPVRKAAPPTAPFLSNPGSGDLEHLSSRQPAAGMMPAAGAKQQGGS